MKWACITCGKTFGSLEKLETHEIRCSRKPSRYFSGWAFDNANSCTVVRVADGQLVSEGTRVADCTTPSAASAALRLLQGKCAR